MTTQAVYTMLLLAAREAGLTDEQIRQLLDDVISGDYAARLLEILETHEQKWLIERSHAWPPSNCFLADWPTWRAKQ